MNNRIGALLGPLAAALLVSACGATNAQRTGGGDGSLPAFEARTVTGEVFDLGEHLGEDVVLMSFWATWCEPCKTEMPFIQRLHEEHAGEGLQIVAVSIDGPDTRSEVVPYVRSHGFTFPVVIDADTSIVQAYNPRAAAPFTVLVDRTGRVARTIEGFQLSEAAELESEVERLLGERR